jgi:hypothetical protein
MDTIERRAVLKGAGAGLLAFTVGNAEVLLTPRDAHAQGAAYRTLNPDQVATLEAMGETLLPGARTAGIANLVDSQISGPADECLLAARILNIRPPYANFYRAGIAAIDRACQAANGGKRLADLNDAQRREFVDALRQNKLTEWQGPPQPLVYAVMRHDSVDVVYGTMAGYEALGIPYMPHIAPERRW